ncbi:C-5 cytosine-specific DNA methylase [plant metagenome]|uniref:C-5 cytosine-specific DNA methylase n=1 Tax=plant metagenome TaxID=1297885 RepID=A0A484P680_9ZZZZ
MVTLGGIDVDPAGAADFQMLTGVPCMVRDLFDLDQYVAFHGHQPPPGWLQVLPQDLHVAAGHRRPNIVFISAPCKGFSGLLPKVRSQSVRYIALNRLTLRAVWLMLEAWADDPPEVILFENVPLIATRGRELLDQIIQLLRHYGYVVRETFHDCGELGGLAQSRKRFLLIARHAEKVPAFIYEPPKRPLRSVGEILSRYGLPGDPAQGPMHRIPRLNWKTWVRLAFVEPGKDWRSLNRLAVENGHLRDYLIVPEAHRGMLGVHDWADRTGVIGGRSRPTNGAYSVADVRQEVFSSGYGVNDWHDSMGAVGGESLPSNGRYAVADIRARDGAAQYQQYGVLRMQDTSGAVIGVKSPGQGTFSVADPRHCGPAKHSNEYRIVPYDGEARAVTGAHGTGQCVADPRPTAQGRLFTKYPVTAYDQAAGTVIGGDDMGAYAVGDPRGGQGFAKYGVTGYADSANAVIGGSTTGQGAFAVADPRPGMARERGDNYLTGGHYGVVDPEQPAGAVSASACHDNGRWSVADWRMPAPTDKMVCVIRALDGTWHRPFTTLDLAALQSIYDPDDYAEAGERARHDNPEPFVLFGSSDQAWRERIGNAVPRKAAKAMGEEIGRAVLLSRAGGESFQLTSTPIWVRPIVTALAVRGGEHA